MPAYLVDALRASVGASGSVENATGLLIDAGDGLRVINEVEQLAAFEWAAARRRREYDACCPASDRA